MQSVTVALTPEQLEWLDEQDENRSELVREALAGEFNL